MCIATGPDLNLSFSGPNFFPFFLHKNAILQLFWRIFGPEFDLLVPLSRLTTANELLRILGLVATGILRLEYQLAFA